MSGSKTMTAEAGGESSAFETVPEVGAEVQASEVEATLDLDQHVPVSHAIQASGDEGQADGGEGGSGESFSIGPGGLFNISFEAGQEGGSEAGESQFESVEGFQETTETAGAAEAIESTRDAWFAEATEAEQQEFFAFLAPLLLPLAKSVIPALAGAAAKNLPGTLSAILQRLGRAPRRRRTETGIESSSESGVDEAMLEAAAQQLEMIVDFDDRIRVLNTSVIPWRRICHLQITSANGGRFLGTGALIGPRTVITAGHCVYMHSQGGWPSSIRVTPGRNGSSEPFNHVDAVGLRSVRGWVTSRQREFDYGAIILPPSFAAQNPSAFGFASLSDAALTAKKLNTAGFPGDKPAGTMWFAGRRARKITPRTLVYNTATMGGQSGSPVWIKQAGGQRIMVGIHTNGSPSGNSATRITPPVLANMKRWRNETMQPMLTQALRGRQAQPNFQSQMQDT